VIELAERVNEDGFREETGRLPGPIQEKISDFFQQKKEFTLLRMGSKIEFELKSPWM